ncbi:hypothetical protein Hanom_Chr16g01488101 [Helianthus anomalus]
MKGIITNKEFECELIRINNLICSIYTFNIAIKFDHILTFRNIKCIISPKNL